MNTLLTGARRALVGLVALGSMQCGSHAADTRVGDAVAALPVAAHLPADIVLTGLVGTGGTQPLLARTTGQVRSVFFSGGEYALRGQPLLKLFNHHFVLAPRAGFLGPNQVSIGQYLTPATPVTTISVRSYLVVPLVLPKLRRGEVHPGDSAHISAGSSADRVAVGVVGPLAVGRAGADSMVEIRMLSRAPFRIGEQVRVQLRGTPGKGLDPGSSSPHRSL